MFETAAVPAVTDATFDAEVGPGTGLVAVELTAAWCPPCRLMAPVLDAVAREYAPRLRVLQMDADANPATMARFGVRSLPTLLVFRDGAPVERIVGAVSKAALRDRLDRFVGG
jgi:thioredoxin 1